MTAPGAPTTRNIEIAEESYHRCHSDAFFRSFYQRLLASDPRIPPKFATTDFTKQAKLLQHSIGLLFIFAKRGNPAMLERIATRHSRADVDVAADLYPYFVDSLVATVQEFDAKCTGEVEQAWREAVAPGIAYMISRYDASTPAPGTP